jgi:replicative DNA helicase
MIDPLKRGLPGNHEAEQLVISAAMDDPMQGRRLVAEVSADDFELGTHRQLWHTIIDLVRDGRSVDRVVVVEELNRSGNLQAAGGLSYVTSLGGVAGALNADEYVRIVRDASVRRRVLLECQRIGDLCYTESAEVVLGKAEELVRSVTQDVADSRTSGLKHAREVLQDAGGVDGLFRPAQHGMPFPWNALNRLTLGMHSGQMICLAGRSGRGKSAAAVQIAEHAAKQNAGAVGVYSLEMRADANLRRMACASAGVDSNALRRGQVGRDERMALTEVTGRLVASELWMSDKTRVTIPSIYRGLQFLQTRGRIALVVVDYLQLMGGSEKADSREREVAAISRGLKTAAAEFGVPILVLVQYNREADTEGVRPSARMIRESGAIWHDSDVGILMHEPDGVGNDAGWVTELILEKQREGPTGSARLWFDRARTRFMPLDETEAAA